MTIRQGGAEAVCAAIRDGMKAAGYARELAAVTAERDALAARCRALEAKGRAKDREIGRLRAQNRAYRQERQRDREAGARARLAGDRARLQRRLWNIVMMGLGGWITFAAVLVIIWGKAL